MKQKVLLSLFYALSVTQLFSAAPRSPEQNQILYEKHLEVGFTDLATRWVNGDMPIHDRKSLINKMNQIGESIFGSVARPPSSVVSHVPLSSHSLHPESSFFSSSAPHPGSSSSSEPGSSDPHVGSLRPVVPSFIISSSAPPGSSNVHGLDVVALHQQLLALQVDHEKVKAEDARKAQEIADLKARLASGSSSSSGLSSSEGSSPEGERGLSIPPPPPPPPPPGLLPPGLGGAKAPVVKKFTVDDYVAIIQKTIENIEILPVVVIPAKLTSGTKEEKAKRKAEIIKAKQENEKELVFLSQRVKAIATECEKVPIQQRDEVTVRIFRSLLKIEDAIPFTKKKWDKEVLPTAKRYGESFEKIQQAGKEKGLRSLIYWSLTEPQRAAAMVNKSTINEQKIVKKSDGSSSSSSSAKAPGVVKTFGGTGKFDQDELKKAQKARKKEKSELSVDEQIKQNKEKGVSSGFGNSLKKVDEKPSGSSMSSSSSGVSQVNQFNATVAAVMKKRRKDLAGNENVEKDENDDWK